MTDSTNNTPETLKRAANRFHQRKNTSYEFTLFHWPYVLMHEAGFRNWKGLANLYNNLLGLAWDHGTLTKQGLPKMTLHLKPLRVTMGVPTRTFQNRLEQLETLELIKRKRISGDRINGNRTRIIVWTPKYTLKFLRENDQNGNEIMIGYPYFGVPDEDFGVPDKGSTGTPGHSSRYSNNSNSSISAAADRNACTNIVTTKKNLRRAAAKKIRSDGSNRKRQSAKSAPKNSQAGLISWYRRKIKRRFGSDAVVNQMALRTKKWSPKHWKLVYAVLTVIIRDWDDFLDAQNKMKSRPAYPPLEWINSWWNGWLGWYSAHQDTAKRKPVKPLTSGYRKLKI